jgi:hypothetical protein
VSFSGILAGSRSTREVLPSLCLPGVWRCEDRRLERVAQLPVLGFQNAEPGSGCSQAAQQPGGRRALPVGDPWRCRGQLLPFGEGLDLSADVVLGVEPGLGDAGSGGGDGAEAKTTVLKVTGCPLASMRRSAASAFCRASSARRRGHSRLVGRGSDFLVSARPTPRDGEGSRRALANSPCRHFGADRCGPVRSVGCQA